MNIRDILMISKLLPVVTIDTVAHGVPLAKALLAGGISVMEVTLRTPAALGAIAAIAQQVPSMLVGAGTVVEPNQIHSVAQAGAKFAISPGFTTEIVQAAKQQQIPYLPGITTPSEAMAAMASGLHAVKFYPAEQAGGIKTLINYQALFPGVTFCPTGGVNPSNMAQYLALENVICVGGSWLTPTTMMQQQDWQSITKLAQQGLAITS